MIELIPAIDLIDGKCVRLTKGDYNQKKIYNENPVEIAKGFEEMGFQRLHVVDLDGARSKHIVNVDVLRAITTETHLTVDFGGGIKSEDDIEKAFANGASMVTIGSIAVTQPELFLKWLDQYGADKLILGADVKNGMISINGWKEDSAEQLLPFLKKYIDHGVRFQKTERYRDQPSLSIVRSWLPIHNYTSLPVAVSHPMKTSSP